MLDLEALRQLVEGQQYRPLFVTVSGAHLYGFPSPDSDVDLRGAHLLPLREVVGLDLPEQTVEKKLDLAGVEVELVNHSGLVYGITGSGKQATIYAANFRPADVAHDVPLLAAR